MDNIETAIITFGMDITNPIQVYTDPDKNLLSIANDKLTKKCYNNYFILQVKEIVSRTECICSQVGTSIFGQIEMKLLCDVVKYYPNDIVVDMKFNRKTQQNIVYNHNLIVALGIDNTYDSINHLYVPIILKSVNYLIGKHIITANGSIFKQLKTFPSHKFSQVTQNDATLKLFGELNAIFDKFKGLPTDKKNLLKKFQKIFVAMPANENTITDIKNKCVYINYNNVDKLEYIETSHTQYIQNDFPQNVLMTEYLRYLTMLYKVVLFHDEKSFTQHANVWAIISK